MESEKRDLETVKEYQIKINSNTKTMEQKRKLGAKEYFVFIISIVILTDLAILLNIPFLRQILGFLFLTILPGLLIIQVLKLNKIDFLEKFILTWGLSISFLMFFGLLINNLSLSLGYLTPLSTIPLLISFNLAFIILAIKTFGKSFIKTSNPEEVGSIGLKNCLPNLELTTSEKAFLTIPILFPALSIFGMHVMNTTDNNIILMFLLFLIPIYVAFVGFFNQKFPKKLYPVVIFLISISLLLLLSLRSNHIIGMDTHKEYFLFQTTLDNLHWYALSYGNQLDACLSISLLPVIYQSILNISSEFLFKILYSVLYSIVPLIIYVLSKKYVGEFYGFLTSCFFMFQLSFLMIEAWARISIAILFFALAMMVLFNDKIEPLKKRILFIVFMASCMVSHYSTTYIFFFVMLGSFVGIEILSRKYTFKKIVSLTNVILFFSMIFFWYSQVTVTPFNAGVGFVENTFLNLNKFFIEESRSGDVMSLSGQEFTYPILTPAYFVFTWCTFILIGIGVLTMIRRHKEMIDISNVKHKKPDFLKAKFEMEYLALAVGCAGLLVIIIALPFVSKGYDLFRTYTLMTVILSVCFIMGGITLSKHFFFFKKRKPVLKEKHNCLIKKQKEGKNVLQKPFLKKKNFTKRSHYQRNNGEKGSEVRGYLIILLILIPYSMFTSGLMYQIFGDTSSIILNSEGKLYDMEYVHDQESYGAKWLKEYGESGKKVYTDSFGKLRLVSQAGFSQNSLDWSSLARHYKIRGYIYLGYYNVVNDKLFDRRECYTTYNLTEYDDVFIKRDKIYNNGGSDIYR